MSASRMPTRRSLAASARARLTAVVDLPTPPLPDATATIVFTPGTSCFAGAAPVSWTVSVGAVRMSGGAASGALRRLLGGQHGAHRQDAGQRVDDLLGRLAQRFELRRARRLDLEGEGDVTVAHGKAGDHAEADDIAALLRIAHLAQGSENLLFCDLAHRLGATIIRRSAPPSGALVLDICARFPFIEPIPAPSSWGGKAVI